MIWLIYITGFIGRAFSNKSMPYGVRWVLYSSYSLGWSLVNGLSEGEKNFKKAWVISSLHSTHHRKCLPRITDFKWYQEHWEVVRCCFGRRKKKGNYWSHNKRETVCSSTKSIEVAYEIWIQIRHPFVT